MSVNYRFPHILTFSSTASSHYYLYAEILESSMTSISTIRPRSQLKYVQHGENVP